MLFEQIFNEEALGKINDSELLYALTKNQAYRGEVEKWLQFFDSKGWLRDIGRRLKHANTWPSFYSKVNELRTGFFFEKEMGVNLTGHEVSTINGKRADFRGVCGGVDIYIEVKTPLDLDRKLWGGGSVNNAGDVRALLDTAVEQLPNYAPAIIVLSDDLKAPLFSAPRAKGEILNSFNFSDYDAVSAICVLGNIYHDEMYKLKWALNDSAKYTIDRGLFQRFPQIRSFLSSSPSE